MHINVFQSPAKMFFFFPGEVRVPALAEGWEDGGGGGPQPPLKSQQPPQQVPHQLSLSQPALDS